MGTVADTISFSIRKKLLERFPKARLTSAADRVREEIVKLMLIRITNGMDIYGKPFANYKPAYRKIKQRFISGDFRKNKSLRKLNSNKTAYKATKVGDFMRLSGQLLDDIRSAVVSVSGGGFLSGSIKIKIRIYVGAANAPKGEGLMKRRKWFGMSKSGTQAVLEQKRIAEILRRELGK